MKKIIYVLMIFLIAACSEHAGHSGHDHEAHGEHEGEHKGHSDDHHAEREAIKITEYSNEYELYAEAEEFVKGHTSSILAHFTRMKDFKPLTNAAIVAKLSLGDTHFTDTAEKIQPGIYKFHIRPELSGDAKLIFSIRTRESASDFQVPNMHVLATENEDEHDEAHEEGGINTLQFTKEQSWKIDFATSPVVEELFGQVIKTTGMVQAVQGDEMFVSAKINGVVSLLSSEVLEGKKIQEGNVLFSISARGMAENNVGVHFEEVKNNFEKAKKDYDRALKLAEQKIVSEKELLELETVYKNTKAEFEDHRHYFSASGQKVTSSMTGYVKQVFVRNGEYVTAGQAVLTISKNKTLLIRADVQQRYQQYLPNITSVNIRTLHDDKTYTFKQLGGKVLSVGKNIGENNYLIPVSLQINNVGSFIPGGFVELYIKTGVGSKVKTIPNGALIEEQGNYFVLRQINPELFEKTQIHIGATDGMNTEVVDGLNSSDRVVSRGTMLVKLSKVAGALDAHSGHVH